MSEQKIYTVVLVRESGLEHVWFGENKRMAELVQSQYAIKRPDEKVVMMDTEVGEWKVSK